MVWRWGDDQVLELVLQRILGVVDGVDKRASFVFNNHYQV